MSKRYTARDLQAAFVEGAKHEYEALIVRYEASGFKVFRFDEKHGPRAIPFNETYNDRKDRRYAEAAKTYPVEQKARVVKLSDTLEYRLNGEQGLEFCLKGGYGAPCTQWHADAKPFGLWTADDLRKIADLRDNPTEDAA